MSKQSPSPTVVTVPVYRDLDITRQCLESVRASDLPDDCRVLVVNDATPDTELLSHLEDLENNQTLELLHNEENLGFVASANRGLQAALEAGADAVLLNSDTRVPPGWLDRLRQCAYRADDIGTVTPFSNNATICSYPGFLGKNAIPQDVDALVLDQLFQKANGGEHADIPTAVGFCMYIRHDCLAQVGLFDEDNFGQGYGEECDFSLRAREAGWRNVVAADVFVFHEGAVSFGVEESARKHEADQVMDSLHPDYSAQVREFTHADPLLEFRNRVSTLRLRRNAAAAAGLLEEQFQQARLAIKRASDTQQSLSEASVGLQEALEHNAWFEKEQERLHAKAFEGREYQRLYEDAVAQMKRTDKGIRELETLLESRETRLGEAIEQANWFEKQLGETYQLAVWRQQQLEERQHELTQAYELRSELEQSLRQAQALVAEGQEAFKRTDEALGEAQRHNREAQQYNSELRQALAQTQEQLTQTGQRLATTEAELASLKSSRSWRYTAWLRKQEV